MHLHNRNHVPADDRIVPRFSGTDENLWLNAGDGNIGSIDVTSDFKINIQTRYNVQEAPSFAATMPARDKGSGGNKGEEFHLIDFNLLL